MDTANAFKSSIVAALLVIGFGVNWLWEMAQMPGFVETARRSWRDTALQCAAFSIGDAALILAIYAIAVTTARRIRSIAGVTFYLLVSALGVITAISIELTARAMGFWTYTESMPVVLGLGFLPILQLATLAPLTVWIASRWKRAAD